MIPVDKYDLEYGKVNTFENENYIKTPNRRKSQEIIVWQVKNNNFHHDFYICTHFYAYSPPENYFNWKEHMSNVLYYDLSVDNKKVDKYYKHIYIELFVIKSFLFKAKNGSELHCLPW